MQPADRTAFFDLLDATYDMIGVGPAKVISPAAKALFFGDLQHYDIDLVRCALAAHRQDPERGRFTPKTADVIYQIERRRAVQWVSADEAWATVPKLESDCGLLNQVTAAALAVAQDLIDSGDMIGARVAFIRAYDARVAKAKMDPDPAQRVPVTWVSGGNHPQRHQDSHSERQMVLEQARNAGLLPAPKKEPVPVSALSAPRSSPSAKPDLKALLLALKPKAMPPPEERDYDFS